MAQTARRAPRAPHAAPLLGLAAALALALIARPAAAVVRCPGLSVTLSPDDGGCDSVTVPARRFATSTRSSPTITYMMRGFNTSGFEQPTVNGDDVTFAAGTRYTLTISDQDGNCTGIVEVRPCTPKCIFQQNNPILVDAAVNTNCTARIQAQISGNSDYWDVSTISSVSAIASTGAPSALTPGLHQPNIGVRYPTGVVSLFAPQRCFIRVIDATNYPGPLAGATCFYRNNTDARACIPLSRAGTLPSPRCAAPGAPRVVALGCEPRRLGNGHLCEVRTHSTSAANTARACVRTSLIPAGGRQLELTLQLHDTVGHALGGGRTFATAPKLVTKVMLYRSLASVPDADKATCVPVMGD